MYVGGEVGKREVAVVTSLNRLLKCRSQFYEILIRKCDLPLETSSCSVDYAKDPTEGPFQVLCLLIEVSRNCVTWD